ncbi:MAG: HAD-IIA family hydrolase [Armatimonadota bacterium]
MYSPRSYDGYIFDLDGTIYLGDRLIPGAAEIIMTVRNSGAGVMFVTNKPIDTRENYAAKLHKLGIPTEPEEVMTSPWALAHYIEANHDSPRCFVLGEQPVIEPLEAVGCTIVTQADDTDIVVVSWDRNLTYTKFDEAFQALRQGAKFYATNPDVTCPVPGGEVADAGANIAGLTACSKRQPDVIAGKPRPTLARAAMEQMGTGPSETVLVGDRLQTDMQCGRNAGCDTALVLTGVSGPDDVKDLPNDERPTHIIKSVRDLV